MNKVKAIQKLQKQVDTLRANLLAQSEKDIIKENQKLRTILAECANIAGDVLQKGGPSQLDKILFWDQNFNRADGPYMEFSESVSYPKYHCVKTSPLSCHHADWAHHILQEWERRYYKSGDEPPDVMISDLIADIAHHLDRISSDDVLSEDCNTLQQMILKAENSYQDECAQEGRQGHQFDAV